MYFSGRATGASLKQDHLLRVTGEISDSPVTRNRWSCFNEAPVARPEKYIWDNYATLSYSASMRLQSRDRRNGVHAALLLFNHPASMRLQSRDRRNVPHKICHAGFSPASMRLQSRDRRNVISRIPVTPHPKLQ